MKYFLYALVGFSFAIHSSPSFGEVVIGVLIDGPWERNDEIRHRFEQEILELTDREFDVSFTEGKRVTADWTAEGLGRGLDQLLSDPEVDLIITAGVLGSNEAGHRTSFSKPVIAPFVINAQLQGIPLVNGTSGIKNFTYVAFPSRLTINMTTGRRIDVYPPWAVLTDARVIDPQQREAERVVSFADVLREAVSANLDLKVSEAAVASGREDVSEARSVYLPQAAVSVTGVAINDELGSPFKAERQFSGDLTASQLVFSEQALANVSIQKRFQASRTFDRDRVRLDIIRDAATAYLTVLRGKTFERIQRENLKVSRENLELAMVRRDIGASGPVEVYRWEIQIATDQRSVIDANVQRNIAEIALNRLLRRPLEESFRTEQMDLEDPRVMIGKKRFHRFLENPGASGC